MRAIAADAPGKPVACAAMGADHWWCCIPRGDGWLWSTIGLVFLLFGGADRFLAIESAGVAVITGFVAFIVLKHITGRERPLTVEAHCWAKVRCRRTVFLFLRATITAFAVAVHAYEVNEAFAPVPLVWMNELATDPERLNPRGGAIALGHPLGASGGRLLATLLNHLEATGGRYGLQTMCEGGGMANATIIERL